MGVKGRLPVKYHKIFKAIDEANKTTNSMTVLAKDFIGTNFVTIKSDTDMAEAAEEYFKKQIFHRTTVTPFGKLLKSKLKRSRVPVKYMVDLKRNRELALTALISESYDIVMCQSAFLDVLYAAGGKKLFIGERHTETPITAKNGREIVGLAMEYWSNSNELINQYKSGRLIPKLPEDKEVFEAAIMNLILSSNGP